MLGSAQTDSFGTESDSHLGIVGSVCIGVNTKPLKLLDKSHEGLVVVEKIGFALLHMAAEHLNDFR
ncbi:hypothetical protein DSECCO2_556750 [anaerobic digester metagenome]